MAAGPARGLSDEDRARQLLSGVLLVSDGPTVFRRDNEPVLDRRSRRFHPVGKTIPMGHWLAGIAAAAWGIVMLAGAASS